MLRNGQLWGNRLQVEVEKKREKRDHQVQGAALFTYNSILVYSKVLSSAAFER